MKEKYGETLKLLLAIILSLMSLISMVTMTNATVIVPPQKLMLEGGYEQNTEWVNGSWVFSVVVDQVDEMIGVELPENTTISKADEEHAYIITNSSLRIQFEPVKAYYKRELKRTEMLVVPEYYRGGMNKILGNAWYDTNIKSQTLTVSFYEWGESSWKKYTVWNCSVYKNDQCLGIKTMNTEDGENLVLISTDKGNIKIKNLGRLEGRDNAPDTSDIVLFNADYIYTTDALRFIRYDYAGTTEKFNPDRVVRKLVGSEAYSVYWTGDIRWRDGEAIEYLPAPFKGNDGLHLDIIDGMKGWKIADGFWDYIRDPVTPVVYPWQESEAIKNFDCLVEYLDRKTSKGNIARDFLDNDWYIENSSIIAPIPWGEYSGSPLATCFVPSELVNTWIYREPIADVRIENVAWKDINSTNAGIEDVAQCEVTLRQYAKMKSSAIVYADVSVDNNSAIIYPQVTTITMKPNETEVLIFKAKNLAKNDLTGVVTFKVLRTWDNKVTDTSNDLQFRLLKPVIEMPDDVQHPDDKGKDIDVPSDLDNKADDGPLNDRPDNLTPRPIYENNTLSYAMVATAGIIVAGLLIFAKMKNNQNKSYRSNSKHRSRTSTFNRTIDKTQLTLKKINNTKKKLSKTSDTLLEIIGFKSLKDRIWPSIMTTLCGLTLIFVAVIWYSYIGTWLRIGFHVLFWWFDIPSVVIGFIGIVVFVGGIFGIIFANAIPIPKYRHSK